MNIACNQCGGDVPIERESTFVTCTFCETALWVDLSRTVKHYALGRQLADKDILPLVRKKLRTLEVDSEVALVRTALHYFPVWRCLTAGGHTVGIPAAQPPLEDMRRIDVPQGDLKLYGAHLAVEHDVVEPTVPLEDAVRRAATATGEPLSIETTSLVHVPLLVVDATCQELPWSCVVDAAAGSVYADDWPAASEQQRDQLLGRLAASALVTFALESLLLPGPWWTLAGFALTGLVLYAYARSTLHRMGW